MFIGRLNELNYLEKKYQSKESEFVVIYGRRRIGKTELIKQFIKDKSFIFYSANEVDDYEQLKRFSRAVASYQSDEPVNLIYNSWDDAFKGIGQMAKDEKLILVIDEFPYMVNSNKSIPSILQNIWDHNLKTSNLMIVLSGSSVSFMIDDILGANNPLYGRITGSYKLRDLSFEESKDFFPKYSQEEHIHIYGVLGGVPQYLLAFDASKSIEKNIIESILEKGSRLYDEVNLLMKQELREPSIYFTLIEAIAMGNTKLNDIYQKTQIEKTKIVAYLNKLITLDIVRREFPVTEKQKKKVNVQSGLYAINSNFFEFYFRFVFPNSSMLELGACNLVYNKLIEPHINHYISSVYEDLCRKHILDLNLSGELGIFLKEIGRWWHKQKEIDIVGYNDQGDYVFGECKWRNEKCSENVYYKLLEKSTNQFSFRSAIYYIFSKSGFSHGLIELEKQNDNLHLIDLNFRVST